MYVAFSAIPLGVVTVSPEAAAWRSLKARSILVHRAQVILQDLAVTSRSGSFAGLASAASIASPPSVTKVRPSRMRRMPCHIGIARRPRGRGFHRLLRQQEMGSHDKNRGSFDRRVSHAVSIGLESNPTPDGRSGRVPPAIGEWAAGRRSCLDRTRGRCAVSNGRNNRFLATVSSQSATICRQAESPGGLSVVLASRN